MEFVMDTENKQAFRSTVVFKLMDAHDLTVDEVIESAKKIEDYVFTEHLTYCVANKTDRQTLDAIAREFIENRERISRQQFIISQPNLQSLTHPHLDIETLQVRLEGILHGKTFHDRLANFVYLLEDEKRALSQKDKC